MKRPIILGLLIVFIIMIIFIVIPVGLKIVGDMRATQKNVSVENKYNAKLNTVVKELESELRVVLPKSYLLDWFYVDTKDVPFHATIIKNLRVVKNFCYAGTSERAFNEAMEYVVAGDIVALNDMRAKEEIIMLPKGLKVYVKRVKMGVIKVRPPGWRMWFWTISEAVE